MSCCGGGCGSGPQNEGFTTMDQATLDRMRDCPDYCCFFYKMMMDPCSQMLERNVKRNVYGQLNNPDCCPPPCFPPPPPMSCGRCLVRCRCTRPIPKRCLPSEDEKIDTFEVVPIKDSKALTRPRFNDSWMLLCSRPKWDKSPPPAIPKFEPKILPPLPPRYKNWMSSVCSKTDSNLEASRFSSRKENNELIRAIAPPCEVEPCPCHCCC